MITCQGTIPPPFFTPAWKKAFSCRGSDCAVIPGGCEVRDLRSMAMTQDPIDWRYLP